MLRLPLELAEAYFSGPGPQGGLSFGTTLLATLDRLPTEEYFSHDTYEGLSAAEIVGHLSWCKWRVLDGLSEGRADCYPFDRGVEGFTRAWGADDALRSLQRNYLCKVHADLAAALGSWDGARADGRLDDWNLTLGEACLWICQHDIYHLAQIRNMGLPSLEGRPFY